MTTLIECRQHNAIQVNSNGDYITQLDTPITLEPLDSIQIKNVFIDTKSNSNSLIDISEDKNIEIEYGYYKTFDNTAMTDIIDGNPGVDGKTYMMCFYKDTGAQPTDYYQYTAINYRRIGSLEEYGGINIFYQYTNLNGDLVKTNTYLPKHKHGGNDYSQVKINITAKDLTVTTSKSQFNLHGMYAVSQSDFTKTPIVAGDYIYHPYIRSSTITIPKGRYQPSDLAQKMTQLFNKIPSDEVFNPRLPSNNIILGTTSNAMKYIYTDIYGNDYNLGFVSLDESEIWEYNKTEYLNNTITNMFIGTNTIAFIYDEVLQKFKIDQMHKPIYEETTGNMVISVFENTVDNKYYMNNKSSGIFFTNIIQGDDFFTEILGFDLTEQLITTLIPKQKTVGTSTYTIFTTQLIESVNITANYMSLDTVVPKKISGGTAGQTLTADIVPNYNNYYSITTTNNPIIAKQPFVNDLNTPTGYFLIDVSEFNTRTISENTINTKIKGIVSRFYSANSYTSGGVETDIPYINISDQSQYINSLHIRILNPDGTLADIDDDNCIYFVINKNNMLNKYIADKNNKIDKS